MFRCMKFNLLACAVLISACTEIASESTTVGPDTGPDQELWDSRIIWSDDGKVSAIIHAGHVSRFVEAKRVDMDDSVTVDMYDQKGNRSGVVTGLSGQLDERRRLASVWGKVRMHLYGDQEYGPTVLTAERVVADDLHRTVVAVGSVLITNDAGVTLETEELRWDQRAGSLVAQGWVRITSDDAVEEGVGLVANSDLTEWTMNSVFGQTSRSLESLSKEFIE